MFDKIAYTKRDVQSMMNKMRGFSQPTVCVHIPHHFMCTIKKNGECRVCGRLIDGLKRSGVIYVERMTKEEEEEI